MTITPGLLENFTIIILLRIVHVSSFFFLESTEWRMLYILSGLSSEQRQCHAKPVPTSVALQSEALFRTISRKEILMWRLRWCLLGFVGGYIWFGWTHFRFLQSPTWRRRDQVVRLILQATTNVLYQVQGLNLRGWPPQTPPFWSSECYRPFYQIYSIGTKSSGSECSIVLADLEAESQKESPKQ